MCLAFILSLFICPKDTARCGEASSPHNVIDVVINGRKQKTPAGGMGYLPGLGVVILGLLE